METNAGNRITYLNHSQILTTSADMVSRFSHADKPVRIAASLLEIKMGEIPVVGALAATTHILDSQFHVSKSHIWVVKEIEHENQFHVFFNQHINLFFIK